MFWLKKFFNLLWQENTLIEFLLTDKLVHNSKRTIKNIRETLKYYRRITKNIRVVRILKTSDTGCDVVRLIDADNNQVSLWLYENGEVRAITPY